ncbi:MAG: hypothetical protein ACR2LR_12490 [Hassallia sp.]
MLMDVYLVRRRFDDEGGGDDGFCRISIILAIASLVFSSFSFPIYVRYPT